MKLAQLSGGVGGARLAQGLTQLEDCELTVIVNVGDDELVYGLAVSPDLDTMIYTLAEVQGPEGWGLRGDRFEVMEALADFGVDTTFRIGDHDLATSVFRSHRLEAGDPLSEVVARVARRFAVKDRVLPATDDRLATEIKTDGRWISFQDYFVVRGHEDPVDDVRFVGADKAEAAPGVVDALEGADAVIIGPSNPPLSIWPILAVPGVAEAVEKADRVVAVSPLIGGQALKGPAADVLLSLGFTEGNRGVAEAYGSLITDLVIDSFDARDRADLADLGIAVHVTDTRIKERDASGRFADWLAALL